MNDKWIAFYLWNDSERNLSNGSIWNLKQSWCIVNWTNRHKPKRKFNSNILIQENASQTVAYKKRAIFRPQCVNADKLSIWPWRTTSIEIWIKMSPRKMHSKMSSAQYRPFYLGFNVFRLTSLPAFATQWDPPVLFITFPLHTCIRKCYDMVTRGVGTEPHTQRTITRGPVY